MKWITNITGLFVGQNSHKREIGITAGVVLTVLYWQGYIDEQSYNLYLMLVGAWTGYAFSAKLSKIAKGK